MSNGILLPFKVSLLGCHVLIIASFPLFKIDYKVPFWDCHQLSCCGQLNFIYYISTTIITLGKGKNCWEPNLDC